MNKITLLLLLFCLFVGAPTVYSASYEFYGNSTTVLNQKKSSVKHSFSNETKILSLITNVRLSELVIYNVIGQQTLKKKISSLRSNINLSELKKGVYIAQIKGASFTKTIRLVIK